jgi:hypothetical protein
VKVTQLHQTPVFLRITDLNGAPVSELKFAAYKGVPGATPDPQYLRVEWSPTDVPLDVLTKVKETSANAHFTWTDEIALGGQIPASYGGSAVLTINPSAMDVSSNKFYTRASTVTFQVNGTTEQAGILLRQQLDTLIATPAAYYVMDGVTSPAKTFNVKSNMTWQITNIVQSPTAGILAAPTTLAATTGGPSTGGQNKSFTLKSGAAAQSVGSGSATITFTAANNTTYTMTILAYAPPIADGLEIAPADETMMSFEQYLAGTNPCTNKVYNGTGWRIPNESDITIMGSNITLAAILTSGPFQLVLENVYPNTGGSIGYITSKTTTSANGVTYYWYINNWSDSPVWQYNVKTVWGVYDIPERGTRLRYVRCVRDN